MGEVVGVRGHRRRLPQANVSDNDGCSDEVSSDGSLGRVGAGLGQRRVKV